MKGKHRDTDFDKARVNHDWAVIPMHIRDNLCFCALTGNWWAGAAAPYPSHRSRVHGLKIRPSHQTLPSHREDQVCFLWAVCQLRRTTKVSCIFEAQMQQFLCLLCQWSWNSPGALGPAGVDLLSLHFQGRRTHGEEAKTAQRWLFCEWKCGRLSFSRLQFLKNKGCEEKTHIRRISISSSVT